MRTGFLVNLNTKIYIWRWLPIEISMSKKWCRKFKEMLYNLMFIYNAVLWRYLRYSGTIPKVCHCTSNKVFYFILLYVIIVSRTSFRVDLHSIIYLDVQEHLLARSRRHIWRLSDKDFIKDFFSNYDQISSFSRIWSFTEKFSIENFIFCAVCKTCITTL